MRSRMSRLVCVTACLIACEFAAAADQTPSEKAISEAIKVLEKERDAIDDAIEQAKVDKAIRELESLIEDPDGQSMPKAKPAPITFDVTPVMLKKKFAGKAVYNAASGELTLTYDFPGKGQLTDFDVDDARVLVTKKTLLIDAGDKLTHVAKFKSFTASAMMTFKGMRGVGIASTNGSNLGTGGARRDTIYLRVPDAAGTNKIVPGNIRSGTVPISLTVTPTKTSIRFATEKLSQPTVRKDDVHQVVLNAGTEGCGFSNLIIVGIPDPVWLKEFLEAE